MKSVKKLCCSRPVRPSAHRIFIWLLLGISRRCTTRQTQILIYNYGDQAETIAVSAWWHDRDGWCKLWTLPSHLFLKMFFLKKKSGGGKRNLWHINLKKKNYRSVRKVYCNPSSAMTRDVNSRVLGSCILSIVLEEKTGLKIVLTRQHLKRLRSFRRDRFSLSLVVGWRVVLEFSRCVWVQLQFFQCGTWDRSYPRKEQWGQRDLEL